MDTYKGGSGAGTQVGQAQFIRYLCQEVGSLAFTAAVQLEHNTMCEDLWTFVPLQR